MHRDTAYLPRLGPTQLGIVAVGAGHAKETARNGAPNAIIFALPYRTTLDRTSNVNAVSATCCASTCVLLQTDVE